MIEPELKIPPAELVDVGKLCVDGQNPNVQSRRQFRALKESIKRYGFVVPIVTNRDLLVADGEHRLKAAKELGMKQVSVVRLPVDDVDRRLLRQVMNKIRGEHDLFLDAEEYYRLVSEGSRDLLKGLLNESDLRIDNLLRLREPFESSDEELRHIADRFQTRVESNRLDRIWEGQHPREKLSLKCHVEFSTKAEVTERTLAVCEAFGLGVDESRHFVVFDGFVLDYNRGDLICITGDSGGGKSLLLNAFRNYFGEKAISLDELEMDPEETLIEGARARYKHEQKIPFVPLEQEINQLISGCGKKMAVFLQGLKETGADPGELWHVEWKDLDIARRVVTINHPVKGHNPRTLPISKEWIAMLERLHVTSERIFATNYHSHYENFRNQRKRVAAKIGNPRILQIKFTSFRHWKGTMEYHLTKDILHVKTILGHKCVKNTEIYVNIDQQLFTGFNDQFTSKVAKTIEEDRELIEAGFEFVTERDRNKIYRKRK